MKNKKVKIFTLLISTILIISLNITPSAQSISSAQNSKPLHYMGAKPDSPETIKKYLLKEDTSKSVTLPTRVDNSHLYPTPMDQTQEDCTAWAVGYAHVSAMQALKRNWTVGTAPHTFSPSFLYNLINNGTDEGALIASAINKVRTTGVCPVTYYAIDNAYNQPVTSLALEAASLYKASSVYVTYEQSQIKQALAEGKGVVIGIYVYDDMYYYMSESNYIYDADYGTNFGGHAVCLVGYDDSKQAFKFINSWGNNWCQNGFGWISYNFVGSDDINMNGANSGYVLNFAANDNYVMGDANLDNTLTAADFRLVLRFTSGLETPTNRQYVLSDVDGNGELTEDDARYIMSYVSQVITKLPIYE